MPALIDVVRRSGITAINFTISAPTFEGTIDNLAYVDALVEQSPDVFMVVRQYSDIARAKREGKIGIMPGFQYTAVSGSRSVAHRDVSAAGRAHHATHLQQPQQLRRWLPGTGQCRTEQGGATLRYRR